MILGKDTNLLYQIQELCLYFEHRHREGRITSDPYWVISVMKPPAWKPRQNFDFNGDNHLKFWNHFPAEIWEPNGESRGSSFCIAPAIFVIRRAHSPTKSWIDDKVRLVTVRLWQGGGQVDRNWKIIVVDSGQCQRGHVVREHTFTIRLLSNSCTSAPSLPKCAVTNTFQNFSDLRHLFRVGLIQYHDHEVQNEMC